MRELEARLAALRAEVEWPATPDLAAAVVARLEAAAVGAEPRAVGERRGPQPRGFALTRPLRRRRLALVAALVLLVPAGGAVAFPSARDDVLEWLGLKGAEVRLVPELPPAVAPEPDELGQRVSPEEAERLAGFRPLRATALGDPRELRYDAATGFVTALYDDDVLVAQARGALSRELVRKVVDSETGVRSVTVDGERGVYIDGVHAYLYERPGRVVAEDRPRRAPRALIVNRGDVLVRIEGPELDRALEIARSLR